MKIMIIILALVGGYLIWNGWSNNVIAWLHGPASQVAVSKAPASPAPAPQAPTPPEPKVQEAAAPPQKDPAPVTQAPPAEDPLKVSGIVMGDPPMAIVGGQALVVGEKVGRYKIMAIGTDSVKYRGPGGKIVIKKISKEDEN